MAERSTETAAPDTWLCGRCGYLNGGGYCTKCSQCQPTGAEHAAAARQVRDGETTREGS